MKYISLFMFLLLLFSCLGQQPGLPILGKPTIVMGDTLYPSIRPFRFTNQDNKVVTDSTFNNKVYVADFMFLSCPTICPRMTAEMKRVYDFYANNSKVLFISHTIDPSHDTTEKLNAYAAELGIRNNKWHFVTGKRELIYDIAANSYFSSAYADVAAPGGYVHSGGLLLVDKSKHIRGVYDGTNPKETDRLISDLERLLKEQFPSE